MRNSIKKFLVVSLILVTVISLASCFAKTETEQLWADALYTVDTELGEGAKTVSVTVEAGEKSIVFTIKTDAEILGDALIAHNLIEGEVGQFGLYVKKVNGMLADYDVNQTSWGFYCGGEYMMTGVDLTPIADGDSYELVLSR